MRGAAAAAHFDRHFALVADGRSQQRRLADDAEARAVAPARHVVDERAHAHAADLLVIRERQLQRLPQRLLARQL